MWIIARAAVRQIRLTTACLVTLALASDAAALEQYLARSWTHKDGLPSTLIYATTQTRDGYIWLGTSDGLVRFDGIKFVHQRLFSDGNFLLGPVTALCAGKDGSLWVGSSSGVVMRISGDQRQTRRLTAEVQALAESMRGGVWAITKDGPVRIELTSKENLVVREQIENTRITRMLQSGTSQISLDSSALVQPSPTHTHRVSLSNGTFFLSDAAGGSLWLSAHPFLGDENTLVALRDGRGFVWDGRSTSGLLKQRGDRQAAHTVLANDLIQCLFEDREGDIWAGTSNGLYAFRFGKISWMTAGEGLSSDRVSSVETTAGAVWVGTDDGLDRIENARIGDYLRRLKISVVKAVQPTEIWAATQKGVFTIDTARDAVQPRRITGELSSVTAIEPGSVGCVWLLDAQKGLYLWKQGALHSISADWVAGRQINAIRSRWDGALLIGFSDGGFGTYRNGSFDEIPLTKMRPGKVYDIYVENPTGGNGGAVWIGTDTGLYRSEGQNVAVWNFDKGLPGDRVLWLQGEGDDVLWLGFSTGVAKLHRAGLNTYSQSASYKIPCDFYDSADGLFALPIRGSQAAAAFDHEGELWFTTSAGIAMLDSRHMPKNTVPPSVVIEQVVADNREMPARSSMTFPPLTRNLEIDYTGLSFLEPRKVHFRYRLEGFDKDWQDAGTRRQAFYTNLQPRSYRFRVKAANNDDVWNESGAAIDLAVLPAFYQTRMFSILCALAAFAVVWGTYRFRLQQIRAALKSRFEERLSERTRIAQDLHDELLQSALGVSLQVELTDALIEDRHPAKTHVERALTLSRTLLQKGREVLRDLREKTTNVDDISRRLTETIEDVQAEGGPAAQLVVEGQPRAVNHVVAEDFVQIGCEAIRNAFRHASATNVSVYLIYKDSEFYLEVIDNGRGMPPQMMESGKPGHYGLTGMRERTERIGATLTITSRMKEGTKIAVSVPGKHAYVDGDR